MYHHLEIMIKLRYAELLANAETARLIGNGKQELLSSVAKLELVANKDAANLNYTIAPGQGSDVLKHPNTDQLLQAAKSEDQETDVLGEVIFFKKSVF